MDYMGTATLVRDSGITIKGYARVDSYVDGVLSSWRGHFIPDARPSSDVLGDEWTLKLPNGESGRAIVTRFHDTGGPRVELDLQGTAE